MSAPTTTASRIHCPCCGGQPHLAGRRIRQHRPADPAAADLGGYCRASGRTPTQAEAAERR